MLKSRLKIFPHSRNDPYRTVSKIAYKPGPYFPLELLFQFPSFKITEDAPELHKKLLNALKKIDPTDLPLDIFKRRILSGMEQFERLSIGYDPYPYGMADLQIFKQNAEFFSKCFSDVNLVEWFIGGGRKTKTFLSYLEMLPQNIFIHDKVLANLKHARKEITGYPYSKQRIFDVCGDINVHEIWDALRVFPNSSNEKCSVLKFLWDQAQHEAVRTGHLSLGVTFNDFSTENKIRQLKFLHDKFPPGTISAMSIDCTTEIAPLTQAYDKRFKQITFTAAMYALWAGYLRADTGTSIDPSVSINPEDYSSRVKITPYEGDTSYEVGTTVQAIIRNDKTGLELPFEPIDKIAVDSLMEILDREQMELLVPREGSMVYTEDGFNHSITTIIAKGAPRPPGL